MPTPGKVLVVLVLVMVPVWIILASAVAQLNMNAGAQVATLKKNVENLEAELATLKKNVAGLKDQISLEQETMNQQLVVARSRQVDLQKARSQWIENVTRSRYQVAGVQEEAKRAEATRDLRAAEKMQEIAAKQAVEAEVELLKQEHAQLSDQLEKLRSAFKTTVDANRKLLDRLKAKKSS
jgi:hypothetical protein